MAYEDDSLLLKWGSIKGWELENPKSLEIVKRWIESGVSASAAAQRDTAEQKLMICELIDVHTGSITNDWSGETMSPDEAKKYVMEYRT
jgi:hypothetical protein